MVRNYALRGYWRFYAAVSPFPQTLGRLRKSYYLVNIIEQISVKVNAFNRAFLKFWKKEKKRPSSVMLKVSSQNLTKEGQNEV
jgi:hypothetical protein